MDDGELHYDAVHDHTLMHQRSTRLLAGAIRLMAIRGVCPTAKELVDAANKAAAELTALRERNAILEAQVAAFKKASGEMANAIRGFNESRGLGTGDNR